jgi:hypothetical protein
MLVNNKMMGRWGRQDLGVDARTRGRERKWYLAEYHHGYKRGHSITQHRAAGGQIPSPGDQRGDARG